jgi:hypothetical protein
MMVASIPMAELKINGLRNRSAGRHSGRPELYNHALVSVGFLDEMLTVFDDHHHPVVLIGHQALCWMAGRLNTGQVCLPALN